MVVAMLQAVHPVCVVESAREQYRSTWATARRGAECVREASALSSQLIQIGSLDERMTVASRLQSLVVGHEQHDVARGNIWPCSLAGVQVRQPDQGKNGCDYELHRMSLPKWDFVRPQC